MANLYSYGISVTDQSRMDKRGLLRVGTPRNQWPRKIRPQIEGALAGLFGQPIIGMAAWDRRELVPGQINVSTAGTLANLANGYNGYTRIARAAPGAATQDYLHWGLMSVHGYLDPAGPALGHALVAQDLIDTDPSVGNSWYYFGWYNFNTAADPTSFVGIAWVGDNTTGKWEVRVSDGTATPSNSLHSYDTVVDRTQTRRLGIVLDGSAHTASFYDNGALVSTYVPTAVPGEMSLYFGFAMITAAGATGYHKILTGGNPRVLSIVEV